MARFAAPLVCSAALVLGGCAQQKLNLPSGTEAYDRIPVAQNTTPREYAIGPLDRLSVTVFGEKDLSTDQAQVDAGGNLSLPLIGRVTATGKTADVLGAEIKGRLNRYLVDPKVSVLVLTTASQKVIVQGSVNEAGVFPIQGRATLLEALAMAKGASNVADERRVAVFRTVNGQRMGAVFDAAAIQNGQAPDPELLSGDVVVVGHSARRGFWRDFLSTTPALGVFAVLAQRL